MNLDLVLALVLILFGSKSIHAAIRDGKGNEKATNKKYTMNLVLGIVSVLAGIFGLIVYGARLF